jgi:hypothetical protein
MAIVRAPLFSLAASGQIAKALVYFSWKGLDVVRQYVIPTDPQTAAQLAQRAVFTTAVYAWRNYFTDLGGRESYHRAASFAPAPMSEFNYFQSIAMEQIAIEPHSAFSFVETNQATRAVVFNTKYLDTGSPGAEAGDWEIWIGTSPDSLRFFEIGTNSGVTIFSGPAGPLGSTVFAQLRKNNQWRSGIAKIVLAL